MRELALGVAIVAAGCGGIVTDTSGQDGGSGAVRGSSGGTVNHGSGGTTAKGGGSGTGGPTGTGNRGTGATTTGPKCGNGVIETGEQCDGTVRTSSCSTATMGAHPLGTLKCSPSCLIDTSSCTTSGTGGFVGTGGATSVAGSTASGGTTAIDQCLMSPSLLTQDCTSSCGCKVCPDAYAACRRDGGCAWILACAHQAGCVSVDQCYQTTCAGIIDRAGGRTSPGAKYADPALGCLAQNGCGVACN